MLKKYYVSLLFLVIFSFPATVFSQLADTPWPKFHHDIRNTGKSSNFGTTVGKLKWKFVTGGPVTSSPVLDDNGTLYVGSADNNFYAINSETGTIKWKYPTGASIELASPAIDVNGLIYCGSNDGYMYAFDIKNINPLSPEPKWKYKTGSAISSSPAIDIDGTIYFTSNDGYLYGLTSTGALKVKFRIRSSWTSPAIDVDRRQLYVGTWDNRWDYYGYDNGTSILILEGRNYFYALDLTANLGINNNGSDTTEGLLWFQPRGICAPGGIISSPVLAPDGSIIISWLRSFTEYPADCDTKPATKATWKITPEGYNEWFVDYGGEGIYSTPGMIEEGSFFTVPGNNIYRVLPDGGTYYSVATIGSRSESSPSIDGQKNVFVGSNGGYFYSICTDCPETPILWQYPGPNDEPLSVTSIGGTVTIASIISSPAIGDDNRHSVYVGASDGNVYAFYDGARITGKVIDEANGNPLQGVKLTLTSVYTSSDRITYTDSNGNYVFNGVENYSYTVTPEKIGYVFSPQERVAVVKQDQDAANINFTAFDGFTLTGNVVDSAGQGFSNVLITLEGENTKYSATTTTDQNGTYIFSGIGFDTYTVTPALDGYGFDPPSQKIVISSDSAIGNSKTFELKDFISTFGYQVSGVVSDVTKLEGGAGGIAGITINLTGTTKDSMPVNLFKTTDSEGKYSFTGLSNGTYTVTPSSSIYNFEPESQKVTIASANVLNINFYAGNGFSISGTIKQDSSSQDNATLSNITVELFKDNATIIPLTERTPVNSVNPDVNGNFVFIGIAPGSYIVRPKMDGYGFDPLQFKTTVNELDIKNLLFYAKKGLYISGKVSNIIGLGVEGLSISLTGSSSTSTSVQTSKDGIFSFTGLEAGQYTISSASTNQGFYELYPSSITVALTSESKENIYFIANTSCTLPVFNLPFFGAAGTLVNIYGANFGWSKPPDNETVSVTSGETTTEILAGVYFGTDDSATWIKAKVKSWSPLRIVAEAPEPTIGGFNIVKVWVVRLTSPDSGCTMVPSSNFFIYFY